MEVITSDKPQNLHRSGIAFNVALQIVLAFLLLLVANYLGYRHYQRWDMTASHDYTLSESSVNLLKSLSRDVEVIVVFSLDSPIQTDVRALADEYRRHGKGHLSVVDINPNRSPDQVSDLVQKYKIDLKRNTVIVRSGNRMKVLLQEEMMQEDPKFMKENRRIDVRAEEAISSAILNVTEGRARRMYFLAGKGGRSDKMTTLQDFQEIGMRQNVEVMPLNLAETTHLPEDSEGVILAGPRYDLAAREIEMISKSLEENKSLLVLRDPEGDTPKLDAMLKNYGIFPRQDRVLYAETTSTGPKKQLTVHGSYVSGSPITAPFGAASTALPPASSSLALAVESEELEKRNIRVSPLIAAASQYWGETNYEEALPTPGPEDTLPPVWLAASAERGYVTDSSLRGVHGMRLLVIANAALLDADDLLRSNYDFVSVGINWLLDRPQVIGAMPKEKKRFRILISPEQSRRIFLILAILLPGAVLCFGFFVWSARRN